MVGEWKNGCVLDTDWESDVSADDGRTHELTLLEMKKVLEGPLWEVPWPFLDSHDVLSLRSTANKWSVASKYGPYSEVFFPDAERTTSSIWELREYAIRTAWFHAGCGTRIVFSVILRDHGLVPGRNPAWSCVLTKKGCLI